ncbi:MAG: DUF2283 domain-containing protein [Candidatus Diapherotrites archaeon]|nr:DUF2283 domain-containing protein [Candidatus Diapherotrites archaeon]
MAKSEFSYDAESDDLFLYRKGSKSSGSVELGNIILDFDKNGVNALQFIEATETLSGIVGLRVTKKMLSSITAVSLDSEVKGGNLIVRFGVVAMDMKLAAPIVVPGFKHKSPALAFA